MIEYLYLGRVDYDDGLRLQAEIARLRFEGRVENVLLLLEHPPVLTLGRNAHRAHVLASEELLARRGVTVREIDCGGDGEGDVAVLMGAVERGPDFDGFVQSLNGVGNSLRG